MHQQQQDFCLQVKGMLPSYFTGVKVVDFGSLDINGNNRYLFEDYEYTGVDLGEGRNVDVVCRAHEYESEGLVDVVISTEMLEHDEYWKESLRKAFDILCPNGLLLFTCAADPRGEHGTTRTSPADAPFVGDYYRNLSVEDIHTVFDLDKDFFTWQMRVNPQPGDLYFFGVKN